MPLSLRSALLTALGFRHGFSLRAGGVSVGPYASLNLGRNVGDAPDAVLENHLRFAAHVGYAPDRLYEVHQVHGSEVELASLAHDPQSFRSREADAIVSDECAVGVRVADCVAVLLADPASGAVAAVHAGWRGVVADTVGAAVDALGEAYGSAPALLVAAVFPAIGPTAFEVGEDVAAQLERAVGSACVLHDDGPRPHVDLAQAVCIQLARAGLGAACIDLVAGCTFSDSARFFSYRRDGGVTGRHLAAIIPGC
ncbi:MAG: hypothetical protein JWN48_917 [Myxococcaceae bacterium]|nr:hypothetical protein [Myxococcaceae bacterium]